MDSSIDSAINILYSIGGKDLIDYNLEADGNNLTNRNGSVNLMDRWNTPGQITKVGKLNFALPIVNSTRYLYDATYFKIGNISLSYELPKEIIKKLKGFRANLFFNVTNVLYWYKEKSPIDRNGYREYRFSSFPEARTANTGIRISI